MTAANAHRWFVIKFMRINWKNANATVLFVSICHQQNLCFIKSTMSRVRAREFRTHCTLALAGRKQGGGTGDRMTYRNPAQRSSSIHSFPCNVCWQFFILLILQIIGSECRRQQIRREWKVRRSQKICGLAFYQVSILWLLCSVQRCVLSIRCTSARGANSVIESILQKSFLICLFISQTRVLIRIMSANEYSSRAYRMALWMQMDTSSPPISSHARAHRTKILRYLLILVARKAYFPRENNAIRIAERRNIAW